jgi:hypothetical protein
MEEGSQKSGVRSRNEISRNTGVRSQKSGVRSQKKIFPNSFCLLTPDF